MTTNITSFSNEDLKNQLRKAREVRCFSVINRGTLWYDRLSQQQLIELRHWYRAWLDVTDTMTVPVEPKWINNLTEGEDEIW